MAETTEDTATFTIALTEGGAIAEPSAFPWKSLLTLGAGLYYVLRR